MSERLNRDALRVARQHPRDALHNTMGTSRVKGPLAEMRAENGFGRWVVGFDASTGTFPRTGENTWHDDGAAAVEVPDDGVSVVGVAGELNGRRLFWPTRLDTVAQLATAERIAARFSLELCGARNTSPAVEAEYHRRMLVQWEREDNLRRHAEMRQAHKAAARKHKAETWCNPMEAALAAIGA